MTSKKKLRSLLGSTLFMALMISIHPDVSASAVGSSAVVDQSVDVQSDQPQEQTQSPGESEPQEQTLGNYGVAVQAGRTGWSAENDGYWYYYQENGQRQTGWLLQGTKWYWLDPDQNGRMAQNEWFTYAGNIYYATESGAIYHNGFQEIDGKLYYFRSWGGAWKNTFFTANGKTYYAGEDGSICKGITNLNGTLYAFDDATGEQVQTTGWLKKGSTYYWVKEDGSLATGWMKYNQAWYWFDTDGTMMASGWKMINNNLYYFRSWGGIYANGFQYIDGKQYYFRSWGGVYRSTFFTVDGKTYLAQDDGAVYRAEQSGWVQLNNRFYWINEDGSVRTGWLQTGGKWYWLKEDGTRAASEWVTVGNNNYCFDADGIMYTGMQNLNGTRYCFRSWGGVYRNTEFTWQGQKYRAKEDGSLYTGIVELDGKKYCFQEDGVLVTQEGWYRTDGTYYWVNADGTLRTGWVKYKNNWYWLKEDATMAAAEWVTYGGNRYYFYSWGGMYTGVHEIDGKKYAFQSWGGVYHSQIVKIDGKTYYANADGSLATGWVEENGKHYYFGENGVSPSGWLQLDGVYYWINSDGSRRENEMFSYANNLYYVDEDGVMATTGWVKWNNRWYYPRSWGGMYKSAFVNISNNRYYFEADCKMVTGWQSIDGDLYYFRSWGGMVTGTQTIDGKTYVFDENGKMIENGNESEIGVSTIQNFLKNALLPVGNTLYIWGGGHTDAEAESYGVNPMWKVFFDSQDASYNYSDHLYEYGKGLDCSGYVGWAAHQVTKEYATTTSTITPSYYAQKGWGTCVTGDTSQKFTPGDVVSKSGHVWLVVGQCSDGSVVVMHATPPYIQISGTVSASGSTKSEAIELAKTYMQKYYPTAYKRYGVKVLDKSYMTGVNHFTWKSSVLGDPEGYRNKKPAEILKNLFG